MFTKRGRLTPHSSNKETHLKNPGIAIIEAGSHRAKSIMVAEAAKVIENYQRDVSIALMNELAMLLNRLGEQQLRTIGKPDHVMYDLKNVLPTTASDLRL